MDSVALETQLRIDFSDFKRQGKVLRGQRLRQKFLQRLKNRVANIPFVFCAPSSAEPQRQIDKAIFRQIVGDGIDIATHSPHTHGSHFEETCGKRRITYQCCHFFQIDSLSEIGGIFEGKVRNNSLRVFDNS